MHRAKPFETWFALLILVLALLCFRQAAGLAGSAFSAGFGPGQFFNDASFAPLRFGLLSMFGIASLVAAWWLWRSRSDALAPQETARHMPAFGRNARPHALPAPKARPVSLAIAVFAIFALAADYLMIAPSAARMEIPEIEEAPAPVQQPAASEPTPVEPDKTEDKVALPVPQALEPAEKNGSTVEQVALPEPIPETVVKLPVPEPLPTQQGGHRDAVLWLAVSPDGRSIMSAGADHAIKLWDMNGHPIRDLGMHKDIARTALFLPGGERVLTAGDDGEIVLRSVADGAVLHVFSAREHGSVNKVAISADGRRAVSGHDAGTVIVWDLEEKTALHVLSGHDWSISGVAVSPDGRRALSGSIDGTLKLWDLDAGKLLRSWGAHEQGAYGIVFTADGRRAVTGSGDRTIKLWDLETGKEIRRFEGHSGTVYALALSDDGKRILSGSLDRTARLWDIGSGNEIAQFNPETGAIYSVAFGANDTILTGGADRAIRVWTAGEAASRILVAGAPD